MLRFWLLLLPALLSAAGPFEWAIRFDPTRFDTLVAAAPDGGLIQAKFGGDCTLPTRNPISACGPLWVARLDSAGRAIRFATYLGGPAPAPSGSSIFLKSLQTDPAGNILLLLSTSQAVLPTANALQSTVNGNANLYLCKLAADGSRLLYATYLGGSATDLPQALAVDARGAAWILTFTSSPDFPSTPGAPSSTAVSRAAITRLSPDGRVLEYSATIDYAVIAPSLRIDASGAALLIVNGAVLRVSPTDGSIQPSPFHSPVLSNWPMLLPAADGGAWIAGSAADALVPITANAAQSSSGPSPLLRATATALIPSATPIAAHQVRGFAVDSRDRARILAATDGGLFLSTDNGASWTRLFDAPVRSAGFDPTDSNLLYLGPSQPSAATAPLYRSTDLGRTWTAADAGMSGSTSISSIAADPHTPGLLYAAGSAFYRSQDAGLHWLAYSFPGQPDISPSASLYTTPSVIRPDPVVARRVYVLTTTQCIGFCPVLPSLYRSDDSGATFTRLPAVLVPDTAADFAIDAAGADLFVLNAGKVLAYRKGDFSHAETLSLNSTAAAVAPDPEQPGSLYVSLTGGDILHSTDGGVTWRIAVHAPAAAPRLAVSASATLQIAQPAGATDAFALQYDRNGNLLYGTYFGGGATTVKAAALSPHGHLWIAGTTGPGLPVRRAPQTAFGGATDAFLAEFDAHGALLRATYLGGSGDDEIDAVTALDDGSVIVTGITTSTDFPFLEDSPFGPGPWFAMRLKPYGEGKQRLPRSEHFSKAGLLARPPDLPCRAAAVPVAPPVS